MEKFILEFYFRLILLISIQNTNRSSKIQINNTITNKNSINDLNIIFDRVYVINLRERKDRLYLIKKSLQKLNIRFHKVEGSIFTFIFYNNNNK